MLKNAFITLIFNFLSVLVVNAQVGIGTTTPTASAVLDLTSTTQGFLPPRMTQAQRNAIVSPAAALMVWCTNCGASGEFQVYNGTTWSNLTGGTVSASIATITGLTCGSATNNGTLLSTTAASVDVTSVVPYTGGNGGSHSGQTVTSTGVTGLTATLNEGTFASGSGSVTYTITGTPASTGNATFALSIGGQTCTLTRAVQSVPSAPINPVATAGNTQASITFTVPTSSGTSAITGYTVTSSPGGFTASGANSPIVVTGLTNTVAYTFTVVATNAFGNSVASTVSAAVTPTVSISGNTNCTGKTISNTSCSSVSGTTVNDDLATTAGTEYNWTGATTSGMANTSTTQALVEIGGQCWMRYNMNVTPTAFNPVPTWANNTDVGWSGIYTGGPFTNEGLLYQWSAAMNNTTTERAQGICPSGWHVPSDCELMYLENTLGMTTAEQQQGNSWRTSGSVSLDLSSSLPSGTNISGFSGLLTGRRYFSNGNFDKGLLALWSSSASSGTSAIMRELNGGIAGVGRKISEPKSHGYSVRCLKD
ncbi:MAG: hypothetical protein RIQ70_1041 [Bacteroidota bacterium]